MSFWENVLTLKAPSFGILGTPWTHAQSTTDMHDSGELVAIALTPDDYISSASTGFKLGYSTVHEAVADAADAGGGRRTGVWNETAVRRRLCRSCQGYQLLTRCRTRCSCLVTETPWPVGNTGMPSFPCLSRTPTEGKELLCAICLRSPAIKSRCGAMGALGN